jgi:hypothetical protein
MTTTPKDPARPNIEITMQPQRLFSGMFDTFWGALQLSASDRPLRDAATALIELGAPPQARLTAQHMSGSRQVMTTKLASAATGFDIGFDVDDVVVPFRRRDSVINPDRGGERHD